MPTRKKLLMVIHGRHFKPDEAALKRSWFGALRHGIERDCTASKIARFKSVTKKMAYYGDYSNAFLRAEGKKYSQGADVKDRKRALAELKSYEARDFSGARGKKIYNSLPGKDSMREGLADALGSVANVLGIGESLVSWVAPDMEHYWKIEEVDDRRFGSNVRRRLTDPLAKALADNRDVLLIGHSLGTMISYDVLWKFTHYGEYEGIRNRKVTQLVTLGSPLGDRTVKANLKGGDDDRVPENIHRWDNFAAEDDYISYDEDLKDDYSDLVPEHCQKITDHRIYNLAVRTQKGVLKSNPHHGAGYLVHPRVIDIIADWL